MPEQQAPLPPMTAADFLGDFRDITDLPMTGGEEGEHYGYGHIDPEAFAKAATAIDVHLGVITAADLADEDGGEYDPGYVHHRWAVTTYVRDGEWSAKWVDEGTEGAWPITTFDPADC